MKRPNIGDWILEQGSATTFRSGPTNLTTCCQGLIIQMVASSGDNKLTIKELLPHEYRTMDGSRDHSFGLSHSAWAHRLLTPGLEYQKIVKWIWIGICQINSKRNKIYFFGLCKNGRKLSNSRSNSKMITSKQEVVNNRTFGFIQVLVRIPFEIAVFFETKRNIVTKPFVSWLAHKLYIKTPKIKLLLTKLFHAKKHRFSQLWKLVSWPPCKQICRQESEMLEP